jgi:hypothetical protein
MVNLIDANGKPLDLNLFLSRIKEKYLNDKVDIIDPDLRQLALQLTELYVSDPEEKFAQALLAINADSFLFMAALVYLGLRVQTACYKNSLTLEATDESTDCLSDSDHTGSSSS